MDLFSPFKSQEDISQEMSMEHTRYIKFDFHDNDYTTSATEVIMRTISWHMFDVNFRGCDVYEHTFEERWGIFEEFINDYYAGDVNRFANHIADMITLDSFTYHIIRNHYDNYDDMLNDINALFKCGNYLGCDIHFVNDIDKDEDWNAETIYLDMVTGYIGVR